MKDRAIFLGWIAALLLIASLLWSFSFSFRADRLMQGTNKTLGFMNDSRRLASPLFRPLSAAGLFGCWYRLHESNSLFLVFAMMKDGIMVPCGAEISENGEVIEIIPLGNHAQQVMERIPPGLTQVYIRRIESAARIKGRQ